VVAGSTFSISAAGESLDGETEVDDPARPDTGSHLLVWCTNGLALLAVLVSLMVLVGPGVYTIDEAAYRFQAETVDGGTWGLPYPTEGIVEQDIGAPLVNSERGPDQWYPAARHPAYVQLVRASLRLGGANGPVILSIIGVVLAAIGIERLTRWLGGAPKWSGFWLAGLAGPAAFHGLVGWAHAPALGLVSIGFAALLTGRPSDARSMLGGTTLAASAVLLRGEAPIMIAAIVVALLVAAAFDRHYLGRAIAVGVASVVAFGANLMWHGLIVGPDAVSGAGSGRGFSPARYAHATFEILLTPGASGPGTFRLIAVALLPIAVIWVRRNGEHDVMTAYVLAGVAVAAGVIGALPTASYGALLPAFPLLALGLSALGFGDVDERWSPQRWQRAAILLVTAALATLGPIVASVSGGGGLGWGGRYVLLASIAIVPLVTSGCGALWRRPDTKPLLLAALVVTAAVQVSGLRTLHAYHRLSLEATDEITAALTPLPDQVELIIAVDARVGRLAATTAATTPLVSALATEDATELLRLAETSGVRRVAIVSYEHSVNVELPSPWREVAYRDEAVQVQMVQR
jgi:hypothetical protein